MPDSTASPTIAPIRLSLGDGQAAYAEAVARARTEEWARRISEKDTTLWSSNDRVQAAIADRLGWLDSPAHFADQIGALEGFGEGVRDAGFTTAVVAGMGGSSLAPEVLREVFGTIEDWLELRVLDTTDPAGVAALVDDLDPLSTLWIVASKSGTTTEPLAFLADFWERAEQALRARGAKRFEHPGEFVVAVTDPDKSVESIPHHDDFREVFLNPPDIGGRYSGLSYVGLVPASLMGIDLDPLLESARAMVDACRDVNPETNPGVSLGLAIATLAKNGRDKLTLIADPAIASFGAWLEQLLAESTGKHGLGIVPVDREPIGAIEAYGRDRVFVRLTLADDDGAARPRRATRSDGGRAPGDPDRYRRPDRPRRRVLPLGGRDGGRRRGARDRPVRPAERRGGQGPDPQRPRRSRRGAARRAATADRRDPRRADPSRRRPDAPDRRRRDDRRRARRHLARRKPNAYLALQAFIAPTAARHGRWPGSAPLLRDAPAAPRPPATGRASSTRPASCTRAARRSAGSSS